MTGTAWCLLGDSHSFVSGDRRGSLMDNRIPCISSFSLFYFVCQLWFIVSITLYYFQVCSTVGSPLLYTGLPQEFPACSAPLPVLTMLLTALPVPCCARQDCSVTPSLSLLIPSPPSPSSPTPPPSGDPPSALCVYESLSVSFVRLFCS